jgi:hypothetical protein
MDTSRGEPPRAQPLWAVFPFACALSLLLTGSARSPKPFSGDCSADPAQPLAVFLEGDALSPVRFDGTVTARDTAGADGFTILVIRDRQGNEHRIHLRAPGGGPTLHAGAAYSFLIETAPGFPTASGLVVQDSAGIVFAGASDQSPGGHVLKDGLPGLTLVLEDAPCRSRGHSECYDALYNRRLRAIMDGRTLVLFHPHSGFLGNYRLTCLTAQRVIYNKRCADAGQTAVSWTLERETAGAR